MHVCDILQINLLLEQVQDDVDELRGYLDTIQSIGGLANVTDPYDAYGKLFNQATQLMADLNVAKMHWRSFLNAIGDMKLFSITADDFEVLCNGKWEVEE